MYFIYITHIIFLYVKNKNNNKSSSEHFVIVKEKPSTKPTTTSTFFSSKHAYNVCGVLTSFVSTILKVRYVSATTICISIT